MSRRPGEKRSAVNPQLSAFGPLGRFRFSASGTADRWKLEVVRL